MNCPVCEAEVTLNNIDIGGNEEAPYLVLGCPHCGLDFEVYMRDIPRDCWRVTNYDPESMEP